MVTFSPQIEVKWDGASWTDETSRCRHVSIVRGRDTELDAVQAGICTLTMKDTTGRFNPLNAASPLYGQSNQVRLVRVTVTYSATPYVLFYGFTRRVVADPARDARRATIECVDLFRWLDRNKPTIGSLSTTTGVAIATLLNLVYADNARFDTGTETLDTGDNITFSADGGTSALALIGDLLTTERGFFYIKGDGTPTYEDRYAVNSSPRTSVQSTIASTMWAIAPGWDVEQVRNRATVTKTGGTAQTASDATSIAAYGTSDYDAIDSPYLASDAAAASLAAWLVVKRKDGIPPVRQVGLNNGNATAYAALLARDLNDRVSVTESLGGTSVDGHIQRITHEIDASARTHFGTWAIQRRDTLQPFLIGISTIGGTDVITY